MDWWIKLKQMIRGEAAEPPRTAVRSDPRLPSYIVALCSTQDAAFSINITSLSVTGLKIETPRRIVPQTVLEIRVPVGLNLEDRETQEYVTFKARCVWTKRGERSGYECGIRYLETEDEKRNRWIKLVMRSYGVSLGDDRRLQTRHNVMLNVWMRRPDGAVVEADVRDISTGGMRVFFHEKKLSTGDKVSIEFRRMNPPLTFSGQILHQNEQDGVYYGVAFDPLVDVQTQALIDMVTSLSKEATSAEATSDTPQ